MNDPRGLADDNAVRAAASGEVGAAPRTKTCGPKPSDCFQLHVATGSGPGGFNVYRCLRCGSEEWL